MAAYVKANEISMRASLLQLRILSLVTLLYLRCWEQRGDGGGGGSCCISRSQPVHYRYIVMLVVAIEIAVMVTAAVTAVAAMIAALVEIPTAFSDYVQTSFTLSCR